MALFYIYIRLINDFGGFDSEIEANSKKEAIEKLKNLINEDTLPRKFDFYDKTE